MKYALPHEHRRSGANSLLGLQLAQPLGRADASAGGTGAQGEGSRGYDQCVAKAGDGSASFVSLEPCSSREAGGGFISTCGWLAGSS